MRKIILRVLVIVMAVMTLGSASVNAQSYYQVTPGYDPGGPPIDSADAHGMTMVNDNSGNTYYASRGIWLDGGAFDYNIRIWKVSPTGVRVATANFKYSSNGGNDYAISMKIIGGNLYVLVKGQYDITPFNDDVVLIKYNSLLVYQWERVYNGAGDPNDTPVALSQGPSNTIIMCINSLGNIIMRKYNAAGTLLGNNTYDSGGDDQAVRIRVSGSNVYVAATKSSAIGRQTVLIKYNGSLVFQWATAYKGSVGSNDDIVSDLTVDTSGNVYTCGSNYNANYKAMIIKFKGSTGVRLWVKRLSTSNLYGFRIFTDNNANPMVYCNGSPDRYVKLDKNTSAALTNVAEFASINTAARTYSFTVIDVAKATGEFLYVYGRIYDHVSPAIRPDLGIQISKINSTGGVVWTNKNIVAATSTDKNPVAFSVLGSSRVFSLEDGYSYGGYNYCIYRAFSASTGARMEETESLQNEQSLVVYPQPANNMLSLNVNIEEDENISVQWFDMTGKLVTEQEQYVTYGNNLLRFDVSRLPEGMMILNLKGNSLRKSARVIISH